MTSKARRLVAMVAVAVTAGSIAEAAVAPARARRGMVVSQQYIASEVGTEVLWDGGNAIDAAVATAFALAVTHPIAGNLGGGGFLLYRPAAGEPVAFDFREVGPTGSNPEMWLRDGKHDTALHNESHMSVGVPGTVAGLHMAWKEKGRLPWRRLVEPAIELAADGFMISDGLARSLREFLPEMKKYPASVAQFSRAGVPYEAGDILVQADLARTLERIAKDGPAGFYEGETARLLVAEMEKGGGLITADDLASYRAVRRVPVRGTYRGHEVLSMPPVSSGGVALITMLNILEGYDLAKDGFGSSANVHRIAEAMRRAYADRARHLGDPDFVADMPIARLISKEHAASVRKTISERRASVSDPARFEWPAESTQTTHLTVVDSDRNAVSMTYTLEDNYGSKIVVPGAGFLLNNEMGDFNAGPGLTDREGRIGTEPNLAAPKKRMLSSMTPTIVTKDGKLFMTIGSPGGRTIINTVLLAILNVIDFGMNIQQALDAPRFHHQWLPDRIRHEKWGLSPDTMAALRTKGHTLDEVESQGVAQAIFYDVKADMLEGASDRRDRDGAAIGR